MSELKNRIDELEYLAIYLSDEILKLLQEIRELKSSQRNYVTEKLTEYNGGVIDDSNS